MSTSKRELPANQSKIDGMLKEVAARKLPHGEYRVKGHRGLVLLVQPTANASWYLFYFRNEGKARKLRKHRIASYGDLRLGQVCDEAMRLRNNIARGEDPVTEKKRKRGAVTFERLAEMRLVEGDGLRTRTRDMYRHYFTCHVYGTIGHIPAADVTAEHVLDIQDALVECGKRRTADAVRVAMSSVYKFGLQRQIVKINPCVGLSQRHNHAARERVWTDDEVRRFWRMTDEAPMSNDVRLVLKLALVTGQRLGEIVGAHQREFDQLRGGAPVWTIPGNKNINGQPVEGRTKNGRTHVLPISVFAANLFTQASGADGNGYLFPSPRQKSKLPHITSHAATRQVYVTRSQHGLQDMTAHDARRLIATTLADKYNTPPHVIERILNHTPSDVTRRHYNRARLDNQVRQAIEQWSSHLQSIIAAN